MYLRRILFVVLLMGLLAGGAFSYMVYRAFFIPNTNFNNAEAYVYIPSNATFEDVKTLVAPLVEDVDTFVAAAERKGYATHVKGGKYAIVKGMNNNQIINALRSANIPVKVSFNNQESLQKLAGRIAAQIEADSTELVKVFTDKDFLEQNNFNLDQALALYIPNSYEFFWNTTAESFRKRMLDEYHKFWTTDRKNKAAQLGMTPAQVVSLAAVVQKETAKVDERPRVAGLYLNRLKNGILLQADPTVIFAIKKETGNYDTVIKRVLYKDLEMESPYNTYKNAGVPPGPITMPDISSIDAVLNPEKHNYLYMVANVQNFGYHMFAENLAKHNQNKIQYIQWLNQQNINR